MSCSVNTKDYETLVFNELTDSPKDNLKYRLGWEVYKRNNSGNVKDYLKSKYETYKRNFDELKTKYANSVKKDGTVVIYADNNVESLYLQLSSQQDLVKKGLGSKVIIVYPPRNLQNTVSKIGKRIMEKLSIDRISSEIERTGVDYEEGLGEFYDLPIENSFALKPESLNRINNNVKSISVRPLYHSSKIYRFGKSDINVDNKGNLTINEYSELSGLSKEEIKNKFIQEDSPKFSYIKDWLEGNGKLYVYEVNKVETLDIPVEKEDSYQKEINRLNNVINRLKRNLLNKTDEERQDIKNQIKLIEESISKIEKNKNIITLFDTAEEHLDLAKQLIKTNNINTAINLIKPYIYLLDSFELLTDADKNRRLDIFNKIYELQKEIDVKGLYQTATAIGDKSIIVNRNGTVETVANKPESIVNVTTFSASDSTNPIVRGLDRIIRNIQVRIFNLFNSFKAEHDKVLKELKDYQKALGQKDIFDFMFQKDENGKNTGYTVSENNYLYYEELKGNKFVKDDRDSLIRYLSFLNKTTRSITINNEAWENKKKAIEQYVNDTVFADENSKITTAELREIQTKKRIAAANPERAKILINKDVKSLSEAEIQFLLNYFNYQHQLIKGEDILKINVKDKYIDKQYAKIQSLDNNNPLKKYYDFYTNTIIKGRRELSPYFDHTYISYNYIPELEKQVPFYKDVLKGFRDTYTLTPEIHNNSIIDPITNRPIMNIPFNMLTGKLKPEDKEYNLEKVLNEFQKQYLNKKVKEESEDLIETTLNVIQNQKEYVLNSDGTIKYENGYPVTKSGKNNTAYLQAEYLVDYVLYEKRQNREGDLPLLGKFTKPEIKNRIDEIEKIAKEKGLDEKLEKELIKLKNEYTVLTGGKVANILRDWTAKKALAFNLFGGITEIIQGLSSITIEAAGGQFFTDNDIMKGVSQTLADLKFFKFNKSKLNSILQNFNVIDDFSLEYGNQSLFDKAGFIQYKGAEILTKGILVNGILNNEKVYKGDKEYSLNSVLKTDDKGMLYIEEGYTTKDKEPITFGKYTDNGYEPSKYKIALTNKINQLSKRLINRDNNKNPILLNKTGAGRLLGQFRQSWLFEGLSRRFGKERNEEILGNKVRGFYNPVIDIVKQKGVKAIPELIYTLWAARYKPELLNNKFTAQDIADFKRFVRELTWISTLYATYLTLSVIANSSDDDDDENLLLMGLAPLINQFYRSQRDMTFFINPKSGIEIFNDPFASMRTISDMYNFTEAVMQTATGEIYINEGKENEQLKILNKAKNVLPYYGGAESSYKKFIEVMQSAK